MLSKYSKIAEIRQTTEWDRYRGCALEKADVYRRPILFGAVFSMLMIAAYNHFDTAGLQASVNALWVLLGLVMPMAILFATDSDLLGASLQIICQSQVGKLLSPHLPTSTVQLFYISAVTAVPLTPPRLIA